MFENRKKLFEIDSKLKFNVLTFDKKKPRKNLAFDAGFCWYDPIWLDGHPDDDYIAKDERNSQSHHITYRYPTEFIKSANPDTLTIFEFRRKSHIGVFRKMLEYPEIGDPNQQWRIRTYSEFNMTTDSDLFNFDKVGWPLYQGGLINHYNAHFKEPERHIVQNDGESRLAAKWKQQVKELPDRTYRIAWRDISNPSNERGIICTVLPRGAFVGNTLNIMEPLGDIDANSAFVSGLNALLSSFTCDFFIRCKMAFHVSAFIMKTLPIPRDEAAIRALGELAMPLYQGDDFYSFRNGLDQIDDEAQRNKLIARLDARVAHLYGLTYEEYQSVLDTFPLVDPTQKKRCLMAYNDWTFEL